MLTRRQLIQSGLVGGVLLGAAAFLAAPAPDVLPPQGVNYGFLSSHDAWLLTAIAPVMLAVADLDLAVVVSGVDVAIRALPLGLQQELRQLLDLLAHPWGRRWIAGVSSPWNRAQPGEVADFLRRWQHSRLALLRTGFQALHALIMAAWYGNPRSWAALGYQRPAQVLAVLP
jgi:hypothetical protein